MPRKFTPEYPPEFRAEAVRLVREGGRQVSVAAKDLGVSAESLRHWVAQADLDSGRRKNGLTTEERQELVRLRRRVRDLEEDKVILKKCLWPRSGHPAGMRIGGATRVKVGVAWCYEPAKKCGLGPWGTLTCCCEREPQIPVEQGPRG
jgi:transposase